MSLDDEAGIPGYQKKPFRDPLYSAHERGQMAWKEGFNKSCQLSSHGRPNRRLFLSEDEALNLYQDYRAAMMAHVSPPKGEGEPIKLHPYFCNVMSSQAFAMNLAGPFLKAPNKLTPVLQALAGDTLGAIDEVETVDIEVVGRSNYFNEPGSRGDRRSSPDIGVWWRAGEERGLLLIEVKYTEPGFGACSTAKEGHAVCYDSGADLLAGEGKQCPKKKEGRPYWRLLKEHKLFEEDVLGQSPCCPFRYEAYQLMRYQLLAAVIEADPQSPEQRVDLVSLCHPQNQSLRKLTVPIAGCDEVFELWPAVLKRKDRFHAWSARDWVFQAGKAPDLSDWAHWMTTRYFPEP